MENDIEYERPQTIFGLEAKYKELVGLRNQHLTEVKKLTVDIEHIEAAIRLFDPNNQTHMRALFEPKHRAERGEIKRFILNTLREANAPISTRDLTKRWVKRNGIEASVPTFRSLRRRLGIAVSICVKQGLVESKDTAVDCDTGVRCNLWGIK